MSTAAYIEPTVKALSYCLLIVHVLGAFLAEIARIFQTAVLQIYRIAGKFGGELNLAVWRSTSTTAKLRLG